MDEKTRVLIGLGASAAANCAPCFDQYYAKALELRLTEEDIKETLEIGGQMKTGGNLAMLGSIKEIMEGERQERTSCCGQADSGSSSTRPSCCG